MKIKISHLKWLENRPVITEFEGTIEELSELIKKEIIF